MSMQDLKKDLKFLRKAAPRLCANPQQLVGHLEVIGHLIEQLPEGPEEAKVEVLNDLKQAISQMQQFFPQGPSVRGLLMHLEERN